MRNNVVKCEIIQEWDLLQISRTCIHNSHFDSNKISTVLETVTCKFKKITGYRKKCHVKELLKCPICT